MCSVSRATPHESLFISDGKSRKVEEKNLKRIDALNFRGGERQTMLLKTEASRRCMTALWRLHASRGTL